MKKLLMVVLALIMALTLIVGSVSTVSAEKPNRDYGKYTYFDKHYYNVVDFYLDDGKFSVSWTYAESYASSLSFDLDGVTYQGHLVTITSARENEFVWNLLNSSFGGIAWIGATDKDLEGTWTWVTGEKWRYTNWVNGEPSGDGDCAQMYNVSGLWIDYWDTSVSANGFAIVEYER